MKKILFIALAGLIWLTACEKENIPSGVNPLDAVRNKPWFYQDTTVVMPTVADTFHAPSGRYLEIWIEYTWIKNYVDPTTKDTQPVTTEEDLFIAGLKLSLDTTVYKLGDSIKLTITMNSGYSNMDPAQKFPLNLSATNDGLQKFVCNAASPVNTCQNYTFKVNFLTSKVGKDTLDVYFNPTTFPDQWADYPLHNVRKSTYAKLSDTHIYVPYTVK